MSRARSALADVWARAQPLAPALIYAALLAAVYWQLWTPIDGARAAWRFDPRFEYWGDLVFQADSLRDGHLALWNPFDRGGFPLHGDPQPGLLYPPNWPLVLWGVLTGELPFAAVSLKILGHALFGALGMHLLARRLGASEPGCYVAGILFTFTSPKLRYGGSALNWSLAWIPWLALAALAYVERPSWRRAIILGGTMAMVLLAGAPAVMLYALLVAVPLALWQARGRLRPALPGLVVAGGTFVLLVAALIACNLEQLPESVRQTRDLGFIAHSAFTPAHLLGYLVPRLSGENPYLSIAPLLGAAVLLSGRARGLAIVLLSISAAGILLAVGDHAGLLPAVASALPPFGLFRQAHRYLFVAAIGLSLLAGLGVAAAMLEETVELRQRLARRLTWIGGLATLVLAIAYVTSVVVGPTLDAGRNQGLALATISAAAATALLIATVRLAGRRRAVAAGLLAGMLFLDVWTANSDIVREGMTPPPDPQRDDALARLPGAGLASRIYDHHYLDFRPGTRLGVRDFGGYVDDPLGLQRYDRLRRAADKDPRLLGHANVRYILEGDRRRPLARPAPDAAREIEKGIFELTAVAPAVYWVPRAERADSAQESLAALARFVPGSAAVVEAGDDVLPEGPEGVAPVAGRLIRLEPNLVVAEIDAPGPGLVVIAEAFYPAWRATVDDREAIIYPANLMSRAVVIPTAGHHVITMRMRPLRFWALLPLHGIGLALVAAALLWRRRRA